MRMLTIGNSLARNATQYLDELHMDERHGNERGCYLAHAVWYEMFTGRPIADNPFLPGGVTPEQQALLQAAAHEAVEESGGPLVPR